MQEKMSPKPLWEPFHEKEDRLDFYIKLCKYVQKLTVLNSQAEIFLSIFWSDTDSL